MCVCVLEKEREIKSTQSERERTNRENSKHTESVCVCGRGEREKLTQSEIERTNRVNNKHTHTRAHTRTNTVYVGETDREREG